jgi:hypothetical protein
LVLGRRQLGVRVRRAGLVSGRLMGCSPAIAAISTPGSRVAPALGTPATTSGPPATPTPAERLREHLAGAGSPLVKAAYDRGLHPKIVATWTGSKQTERAMKRRHRLAHYCPRCCL